MKKKMKVERLKGTRADGSLNVNHSYAEIITSFTPMMKADLAEWKNKMDVTIESMQINNGIHDELPDKEFEEFIGFVKFFFSIIFRKDHPLRPLIAKHLKNGTCIQQKEGIKLFKKYSASL